jgi:DNA replication and repair protein RecF
MEPHPELNIFYGANGAGKTSILESLVVLSRGRSFRTTQAGELVGTAGDTFSIFGLAATETGQDMRVGLERSGRRWRGRLNGEDLSQLSQLARVMPLVLVEPDSHLLISGPPEVRRKFLDWGMFHVKHGFLETWRRYSKALKQRNAGLRSKQVEVLDSIEHILAEQGERLSRYRQEYTALIEDKLFIILEELGFGLQDVRVSFNRGWGADSLLDSLKKNRSKDLERGVSHSGPHRADLSFTQGKQGARAVLSRGEQKLFAVALLLTQTQIAAEAGEMPLILLDDLSSELDNEHFHKALQKALGSGAQIWLTGTDSAQSPSPHRMFHVEQGQVKEVV